MKLETSQIIEKLNKESSWVSAQELADFFGVSSRTIRNKIQEIRNDEFIEASYRGYRLKESEFSSKSKEILEDKNFRMCFVLRKLIQSKSELSIYDLADSLYISDSTFARVLADAKDYVAAFDLDISHKRNMIHISGAEANKRKLIKSLIRKENPNNFLTENAFENFIERKTLDDISKELKHILNKYNILVNDYGFWTILMHVIIINYQISNDNYSVQNTTFTFEKNCHEYLAAKQIVALIEKNKGISIPEDEINNFAIIISNNQANILINKDEINPTLNCEFISLTKDILSKLAENYYLQDFSEELIINLSMHIQNLVSRGKRDTYTINPLANDFKEKYPLIYDMASYVINQVNKIYPVKVIDDEIAFIAYHIGSYIENIFSNDNKTDCCLVCPEYNNMSIKTTETIIENLSSILKISKVLSINYIDKIPNTVELVISCCGKIEIDKPVVEVGVFITNNDINTIREKVEDVKQKKRKELFRNNLKFFIKKDLFLKDYYPKDNIEMIEHICDICTKEKLVSNSFCQEVIDREFLSSTSFSAGIAIPHSLVASANQSFMFIVLNKNGINWGDNIVNIIILIGTAKIDRQAFKSIFNGLVDIFYEKNNIVALRNCEDYESFVDTLVSLI